MASSETDPSLSRDTRLMAVGTLLSRLTGFGRILALAYAIGFLGLGDAYNLANITPNIVYELVLGGILSGTLITVFVRQLTLDEDGSSEALSAVITVVTVAAVGLSVLLAALAPLVIRAYTLGDAGLDHRRVVATSLLRWFGPQIACLAAITVTTALLNARRRFAAPMFAPIATNVVVIGVLLAAPHVGDTSLGAVVDHRGVLVLLGLGTTAAYAIQALIQSVALRGTGLALHPLWKPGHPLVRELVRLSVWTVGFTVANQVALWVVLVLASRRAGGVSAWQAGIVFFQLPHAIVTVSLASALQPALAEAWARSDPARFARDALWGLRSMAALVVPAAIGYAILAGPLVRLGLEHGALEAQAADTTAEVLRALAIGLPGYSGFLFLVRALMAKRDLRAVFWLYILENAINIVAALALFPRWGVSGLAAAYAIAYTLAAVVALGVTARGIGQRLGPELVAPLARIVAAAAVMGAVVFVVSAGIGGDDGPRLVARATISVMAGVSVYLLAARAAGVGEVRELFRAKSPGAPRAGDR